MNLENEEDSNYSNAENTDGLINSSEISEIGCRTNGESSEGNQSLSDIEWAELPSLPIEKIYTFLSRHDQCRMSLVCHRWAKEYGSPSVWKTFKFYLPEHECSLDIYPEVKFARKYGNMFRNVEIICKRIRGPLLEVIWIQLKMFLDILTTNSHLVSLKFVDLGRYFRLLSETFFSSVFQAIVQLLESQSHLRSLEFHDCFFSFEEAVELLRAVSETSSNTLNTLRLRGFVDVDVGEINPNNDAATNLCSLMQENFLNLTTIEMDYSQIFENMLPCAFDDACKLGTPAKCHLSKIILNCVGIRQSRFRGIPPVTWKYLRQSSPNLKVDLHFIPGINPRREIEFFVVPGIPLKFLDFRLERLHNSEFNIGILLNHLWACKCHEHLESLYIVWMRPIPDLSTVLVPFLQACSQLKSFQLFAQHPVQGIEEMFKAWLENRPASLEEALISVSLVRHEEDHLNLITMADEYVPLLQIYGLNAYLVVETGW